MRKLIVLMMVCLFVSSVVATFVEDFESYSSPYQNVQEQNDWTQGGRYLRAKDDRGFNGSAGAVDLSASWTAGENFQDVSSQGLVYGSGNQILTARFYADDVTDTYGFPSMSIGSAIGSSDYVYVELYNNQIKFLRRLTGLSDAVMGLATGLQDATWYDVKMEFNMDEGTAGKVWWVGYRLSTVDDSASWIRLNGAPSYPHYDLTAGGNTISLNSLRIGVRNPYVGETGRIDDIVLTPEPATMALLGLGGLFLRRRK